MKMRSIFLAVLVLFAFCTCTAIARDDSEPMIEDKGLVNSFLDFVAEYDSLRNTKLQHRTFTFRGQFHRFGDLYEPFYSVFSPSNYFNISAWDYDAPIWHREQFTTAFPLIFVPKFDKELKETILTFKPYQRFEATGEIRSIFGDMPWIQINSLKKIGGRLTDKALVHINRGIAYRKKGDYLNAMIEYNEAYSDELPEYVKSLIYKHEGIYYFLQGEYRKASRSFWRACGLKPDAEAKELAKKTMLLWESQAGIRTGVAEEYIIRTVTEKIRSQEDPSAVEPKLGVVEENSVTEERKLESMEEN